MFFHPSTDTVNPEVTDRKERPFGLATGLFSSYPYTIRFLIEALREAEPDEFEGVPVRVVRANYLAVIALSVGRHKDYLRILALLDSGFADRKTISEIASRHGLAGAWEQFKEKFVNND